MRTRGYGSHGYDHVWAKQQIAPGVVRAPIVSCVSEWTVEDALAS